tara:strand:+ start:4214 stop:4813 length:600 start_codon:yes stop_codon:yes gene_type:complete
MSFNYTKFLKEGGVEKNLQEADDFGNDPQDRYNYVRKFTADLDDTARTEQMIQNLDDALKDYKMTDEVGEFDQAFVDIMKALGKEKELSEDLYSPNEMSAMAIEKEMEEGISDVSENDDVLDEILDEAMFDVGDMVVMKADREKTSPMKVKGMRRMFGSNLKAISVEKQDGETVEYDEKQLVKLGEVEGEVQNEEKDEK